MEVNAESIGRNATQRKWVLARLTAKSDAEAARAIGINPATVCRWPNKAELDATVESLLLDSMQQALNLILDAAPEAARVKLAGLRSRNENIKQSAASEILDRALGKAKQVQDTNLTGSLRLDHSFDAALAKVYGDGDGD